MKRLLSVLTLSLIIILASVTESTAGRWQIVGVPVIFKSEVSTMTGGETFDNDDGMIFVKDAGGSGRNFNLTGTFKSGTVVYLINTADVAETITFDSTSANQAVGQNEVGIFAYDGTSWQVVWLGQNDLTQDATATFAGLYLDRDSISTLLRVSSYHDTEATTPTLTLRKADGSGSSPGPVDQNAILGTLNFDGYDNDGFDNGARIYAKADANWGASERGAEVYIATRDGAGTLTDQFKITAAGDFEGLTSKWWYCSYVGMLEVSPGASGATWTVPDSNTIGGYRLNASTEYLYFSVRVCPNWDASSDLRMGISFEVNVDNTGGADTDTVDLRLICYYKGIADTSSKTQTLEVPVVVGKSAQYRSFQGLFTIDYDAAGNVVEIYDVLSFRINLETDSSEVDDIITNFSAFAFRTAEGFIQISEAP